MPLAVTTRQLKRSALQTIHHPPKPTDKVTVSHNFQKEKAKMVRELIPFLTYLYKKHMNAQISEGTDLEMLKLINKAMKLMPGSPKQKKVIQQLNKLRTADGLDPLKEDIKIPIKVGDTILGGKFKNKRIVVKSIGKNEKGDITINGKPLLKYRLLDEGVWSKSALAAMHRKPMPGRYFISDENGNVLEKGLKTRRSWVAYFHNWGKMGGSLSHHGTPKVVNVHDGKKNNEVVEQFYWVDKYNTGRYSIDIDNPTAGSYSKIDPKYVNYKEIEKQLGLKEELTTEGKFPGRKGEYIKYKGEYFDIKKTAGSTAYVKFKHTAASAFSQVWDSEVNLSNERHKGKRVWSMDEAAKRDYKKEYEKYGKSEKAKKYRAQLNKYNRDKGTYGNGDGKDASHKGGKIVGFEDESKNRGRREKSRLKKESSINEFGGVRFDLVGYDKNDNPVLKTIKRSSDSFMKDVAKYGSEKLFKSGKGVEYVKIYHDKNHLMTVKDSGRKVVKEKSWSKLPINEIPMGDLQKIDTFADKKLNPVDVVITDKHFFDRLNDPRNGKEISSAELIGFFKRLSKKKKEFVDFLNKYKSVVAVDDRTNINIPFMKQANKAIAKTVMRKKDFKTPDQKLDI